MGMPPTTSPTPIPPPDLRVIEVDVPLEPGQAPVTVPVLANSPEEAFRILYETGNGVSGTGARNFYYGSVLEPIRNGYKARLEQVEALIRQRRAALGPNPTQYELRGLAQWAARQRAMTARIWRIPTPSLLAGLEARDWRTYGPGGRTFENLLRRNAAQGRTGTAAYDYILGSAARSNAEVNASVARGARQLRIGGGILGVAGLAVTAHDIYQAPPERRGAVAQRHAVGFAGGLIGAEIGVGLLAVGAGLLAATPPGWVVLAVGLIAGVAGSIIADRVFYPPEHEAIGNRMAAGYAVDPNRRYAPGGTTPGRIGPTTLPIISQVTLVVRANDDQATLSRRAYYQAGLSAGLPSSQAEAFADRHTSPTGLSWVAGDPSPRTGAAMSQADIAATAGRSVVFSLNSVQRNELVALAGRP
jgi:hypothetical protein